MKTSSRPLPKWLALVCWIGGGLLFCSLLAGLYFSVPKAWVGTQFIHKQAPKDASGLLLLMLRSYGWLLGNLVGLWMGFLVVRLPGKRRRRAQAQRDSAVEPAAEPFPAKVKSGGSRNKRWHSCNILQIASDANLLWHFDAKGGGFALNREHRGALDEPLPFRSIAKTWGSLWQPRLNVAWLPPESVFLRAIELPKSNFEETFAMVELQLEKLSPMPVTQIVWTIHILSRRSEAGAEAVTSVETKAEDLQTVVVVIIERRVVEEFLGKLEGRGYLADRLEVPMLDQLEATPVTEGGLSRQSEAGADAWIYPVALAGQSAALVAWWCGNALRSLSFVVLPPTGDRAKNLKAQLAQLAWAGELEGWLTTPHIQWHLIAGPAIVTEWENALRESLDEPVKVAPPLTPAELAARTAQRAAAAGSHTALLPAEFPVRYHQQFVDRLWLRGLATTGVLYAIGVAIYFCATGVLAYRTRGVERQVAALSGSYTNVMELKARFDVLKERQDLKYAALDCWKVVAERLPESITLQRFSFADGKKLSLSGTASTDRVNTLFDFNTAMQRATNNDRPMFNSEGSEPVNPRQSGNSAVTWSFSLQLQHTEVP